MRYGFLEEYCLLKKGTSRDYKVEWDAVRFMIAGKMFAMIGSDAKKRAIVSLKGDPTLNRMLREKYIDIIPGYYLNKEHWNSVYLDGEVPEDVLKKMIDDSHHLVFQSLSRKTQTDLEGKEE